MVCLLFSVVGYSQKNNLSQVNLKTYEGADFRLSDYLGKQVIVINFWASWCPSCITEIPELHQLKKDHPNALYIGINAGERKSKVKRFLKKYKFNYIILMDKNRLISKSLGVESLPQTFVISKKKIITFRGHRPPKSLK